MPVYFTPEEALTLLVELNLSKIKYHILRQALKQKNIDVLPSYNISIEEDVKCSPTDIETNSIKSCIPLQNLVDYTVSRLIESNKIAITSYEDKKCIR